MYVEGHQTLEPLHGLAQTIPRKRVWRRFQAVIRAQQGRTAADIAQSLGCSLRAVKNWVAQDNRGGVAALRERPHPGRPRRLAPNQYPRWRGRLDAPPRPEDGVGTLRGLDVQRFLEQEFGVVLRLRAVSDLLHRLDYSSLMPRPQHERANPEVQEFFQEIVVEQIEAIRDAHPDEEVRLYCEDEARCGQQGTITRVRAPKGSRPRRVRQAGSTFLFVLVAVCARTGDAPALIMPELNAAVRNLFLGPFSRELPAGVHAVLIWDGAGYHVSAKLVVPSTVRLLLLPPYSPERNPVENLWHFLRAHHWSNRPYRSYKDLEGEAVRSMRRVCLADKENLKNICNAPYILKRA